LHPPNALSHRKEQQAKSHLSFGMCAFSPPYFSINVHFSIAARFNKITPFLPNVRFFAAKFSDECALFRRNTHKENHPFPSECALFRIRELHLLTAKSNKQNPTFPPECAPPAAKFSAQCALFSRKTKSNLSTGMCTFLPQHALTKSHTVPSRTSIPQK